LMMLKRLPNFWLSVASLRGKCWYIPYF